VTCADTLASCLVEKAQLQGVPHDSGYPEPVTPERETVDAPGAPAAVGPYSHAVRAGGLLFCSGQIPLDPGSGELVGETPAEQARQCMQNLEAVCAAAGTSLQRAARLTIYTTRLSAFAEINEVYGSFFSEQPPARAAVGVAELPKGALVEIDAVVSL
jgi:2-iminobutanoate/2-iminopropanoate deaminase